MGISLDKIDSTCSSVAIVGDVNVTATDLDIRDLDCTQDNVAICNGGNTLAIDASGFITVNQGTSPWVVSATDLDIRDIDCATDNIAICEGANTLGINADGSIDVNTTAGSCDNWEVTAETVNLTEVELVSTPLASRLSVLVQNLGASDIYVRQVTGVSTSNGVCIPACSSMEACLGDGADLFAIADAAGGTDNVRVVEYAA